MLAPFMHGLLKKVKMNTSGCVIWITGLSGAGKTTLAKALQENLPGSILLDGDSLRSALNAETDKYDLVGRKELAMTYARLARLISSQGFTVIVATISLFHDIHAWNRTNLPGYMEIFMDIPASIREARDPKGLYERAKRGELRDMAGKAFPVEYPLKPDLVITENYPIERSIKEICGRLKSGERS